jgi:hypothetical protein
MQHESSFIGRWRWAINQATTAASDKERKRRCLSVLIAATGLRRAQLVVCVKQWISSLLVNYLKEKQSYSTIIREKFQNQSKKSSLFIPFYLDFNIFLLGDN